ncbi:MAG: DUF1318 domain-containing protein [Nitrospiraceae bacterium]|nr:DUF1318 domain-containing protein [Nitrospiraceae bacterium]
MKKRVRLIASALLLMAAACAVITVNIYFPEKDVKEAYKELEKELMTPGEKPEEKKPATSPEEKAKPESSIRFDLVATAYAQEAGLAEKIADLVKKMPDVVNAYKEMGARIADTDRLRDSGAVGEASDGLLVPREKTLSPADSKIVEMENANRSTVIRGMAKAIVRINRLPETPDNLKQVLPQAADQFAAIRRDAAKKGWWIQTPDGNWRKK